MAELNDLVQQNSGRKSANPDNLPSIGHLHDVVDRSRQLCRTAAERMQEAAAIQQRCQEKSTAARRLPEYRPAVPTTHFTEHALWHGA